MRAHQEYESSEQVRLPAMVEIDHISTKCECGGRGILLTEDVLYPVERCGEVVWSVETMVLCDECLLQVPGIATRLIEVPMKCRSSSGKRRRDVRIVNCELFLSGDVLVVWISQEEEQGRGGPSRVDAFAQVLVARVVFEVN
jgi:hypothetical protein